VILNAEFLQEDVVTVGRIVLDSESASAAVAGGVKLNEASLVFESSRTSGAGARTPLRFTPDVKVHGSMHGMGGIGLFPGAIVALRGKNGGAGWFEAKEILSVSRLRPTDRNFYNLLESTASSHDSIFALRTRS
jgi:DNA polymerase alpha subunit B